MGSLSGVSSATAHGGVDAAKRVAADAASKGVAILPGFGTTWYGGAYYEGNHRYNLSEFLRKHPDARMLNEKGEPYTFNGDFGACPAHPAYQAWLRDSLRWMFREFEIGGLNLENGDMLVDHHPLTRAMRKDWPGRRPGAILLPGPVVPASPGGNSGASQHQAGGLCDLYRLQLWRGAATEREHGQAAAGHAETPARGRRLAVDPDGHGA